MGHLKRTQEQAKLLNTLESLKQKFSVDQSFPSPNDEDFEKARQQETTLEEKQKEAELNRYNQDTLHRSSLIVWAATVVSFWLLAVIFILTGNTQKYKLSDTIVVTLLGTTTVNVLGLMIIVLNDLFKGKSKA